MPFGFALTDPGGRISRTRLFPRVTRVISEPAPKSELFADWQRKRSVRVILQEDYLTNRIGWVLECHFVVPQSETGKTSASTVSIASG
jgi:hypothetical protein